MAPINTHEIGELSEYFAKNFPDPWWQSLFKIDTSRDVDVDLGNFKARLPLQALRPFTISPLLTIAAKRFIRPPGHYPTREELARLHAAVGLTNLKESEFAEKLRDRCVELQHLHEPLSRWIRRQLALIDFMLTPPPEMSPDSRRAAIALRNLIARTMALLPVSPSAAFNLAEQISRDALRAAALATCSVFGGECHVSANLMVPVRNDRPLPTLTPGSAAELVRQRADALWAGLSSDRRLLIVAETRGAGHIGFWAPAAKGTNGRELPGAPYAYLRMGGQAVFKDDLPRLDGFPGGIGTKWHQYMQQHFNESLFVSLPILFPDSALAGTGSVVAAVLNVNASPQREETWFRAYHEEWLRIAQARVAEFAEAAYYAFQIQVEACERAGNPVSIHIDTGSIIWDRLPFAEAKLLTERESS